MKGKSTGSFSSFLRKEFILVAILVVLAVFAVLLGSSRAAFRSSELRFTDASAHGLAIMPASCSSAPGAQCTGTCQLSSSSYLVTSGQSVTLTWNGNLGGGSTWDQATLTDVGNVGAVGSASVTPSQTKTYVYTDWITDSNNTTYYVNCSVTITVGNGPGPNNNPNGCPIGYTVGTGGQCVFAGCPTGYTLQGSQCVFAGCPTGYVQQGSQCVFSACPSGYVLQGNQCVSTQCSPQFYCSNGDLYRQLPSGKGGGGVGGSCTSSLFQQCAYGCSSGACNAVPISALDIVANPPILKVGEITKISWKASNVTSCTIGGTNGDSWSCSGASCDATTTEPSSPIESQTIYTLACSADDGSSPSASVTVSIVPTFQEH
ncbi:MAG TPA: hypothetical protein VG102_01585 [Candidatus Paceibacterota bacterium]|nr:hypothetical protein [Candidatus Paceibacterota bacterium]